MRAETWARVSALFEEALRLGPAERAALLERASTDAPEVRAELERLLALDGEAGASFDPPNVLRSAAAAPAPGARIGHYTLVRTIASGGMGTVYEARQEGLQRSVALKTLRLGLVTPERKQRFQFEVEALSRLQHPGIAQVFEYGLYREGELELPFFAMELIADARDLLSFARERDLAQPARLALFVAVCDAVQHGHQRGVIHRDLKPSNLLVDAAGQPKVIDFGVARLARQDGEHGHTLTLPGQIVGTLQYMSPEQLAGKAAEADTRCDVYALGAILHELLTGRLPYELGDLPLAQAARMLAETEPSRPTELPLELGWIVLKCLAREPARRYASAAELKGDLERYLAHQPVLAGPPGAGYRLRKLIRRQRLPLASASAVLAALAFGLVRAQREARAAEREAHKAQSITTFLEQALTSSALFERGPDVRVVDMLEDTAPKVQAELASLPEARAMVDLVIGKSFLGLWRFEEAGRHLEAAWDYADGLPEADPLRLEMLGSRMRHAMMTEQLELCEQLGLEAERLAIENLGPLDERTLLIQGTLAEAMLSLRRMDEAERRYGDLLPRLTEVYGPQHGEVIAYRGGRAIIWREQGRFKEALAEHEEVLALAEQALAPGNFRAVNARLNLLETLRQVGEYPRAEELGKQVIEEATEQLGKDHPRLWLPYMWVGDAVLAQGRASEAIELLSQASRLATGIGPGAMADVGVRLAQAHLELGDRSAAESQLRAILELVEPGSPMAQRANDLLAQIAE